MSEKSFGFTPAELPFMQTYRKPRQECFAPEEVNQYVMQTATGRIRADMDSHLKRCRICSFAVAEAEKAARK